MVNSNRRKKTIKKRRKERRILGNCKCVVCGDDLKDTVHHFLCNKH